MGFLVPCRLRPPSQQMASRACLGAPSELSTVWGRRVLPLRDSGASLEEALESRASFGLSERGECGNDRCFRGPRLQGSPFPGTGKPFP